MFKTNTRDGVRTGVAVVGAAALLIASASSVVWPSDETGPRDRLRIQHVRFVLAMAGVLGIGSDLLAWTPEQVQRATDLVALYRSIRHVIHTGTVRRHGSPTDASYALEYANPGDDSGTVCILVYDHDRDRRFDREQVRIRPKNLLPLLRYRLRSSDIVVTGAAATSLGVVVPFGLAVDADVLIFDPLS